jgi:hypothetical protein
VRFAPVREEEEDGRLEKKKKRMGHGWAERPDGPKVKEKFLSE